MLLPIVFLASQALDRADALNETLTKCLFAAARAAGEEGQSADRFRARLRQSCLTEEASARAAAVSILMRRGLSRTEAEGNIDQALRQGRDAVLQAYSYREPR